MLKTRTSDKLVRRVTDNSLYLARTDPEHFITTDHGPLLCYNRYNRGSRCHRH